MRRFSLVIGGKRYTITLEEPYADRMEKELTEIFDIGRDNETRKLLEAFLQKRIETFELERKIRELNEKLENKL